MNSAPSADAEDHSSWGWVSTRGRELCTTIVDETISNSRASRPRLYRWPLLVRQDEAAALSPARNAEILIEKMVFGGSVSSTEGNDTFNSP